jgi:predicted aspartyl protease
LFHVFPPLPWFVIFLLLNCLTEAGVIGYHCAIGAVTNLAAYEGFRAMETGSMGRVPTEATIENLEDLWTAQRGQLAPEKVRRIVVAEALVDSGATLLSVPTRLIKELGLRKTASKHVTSSIGVGEADMFDAVRLTIQGRTCTMDVMEVPDTVPVLIGQLPLEHLDFVVDMRSRKLIGNPAHGGEHVYELY